MTRLSGDARNHSLPLQKRRNEGIPASRSIGKPTSLEQLKLQIQQLEGFDGTLTETNQQALPFGVNAIDAHLPAGGVAKGALHEVFASDAGIATAFCALLAGRLAKHTENHAILWCERPWALDAGALYGPALLQFGIDPALMILVRPRRDADALWAMEEGLRCGRVAAVIGEITNISLTASRRLQLAAEETGGTALMLRPKTDKPSPSAAVTRWRLDAVVHENGKISPATKENDNTQTQFAPTGLGTARWSVELFRCRGGTPANWMMEWNDETGNFSLAAQICNRPSMPSTARLAG